MSAYQRDEAIARLRAQVADLQSGMFINCVYCGHRYGPAETMAANIPEGGSTVAEELRSHIARCPEHPMSTLRWALEVIMDLDKGEMAQIAREALLQAGLLDSGLPPEAVPEWIPGPVQP
jgi:hypothetical protein